MSRQISEGELWARWAERPYRRHSTAVMSEEFGRIEASRRASDVLVMWVMHHELEHYRQQWRMQGTSLTAAGRLFERIDYRLAELAAEGFAWPFTDAPGGDGSIDGKGWADDTPLSRMGYSVARNGPDEERRREILRAAFLESLPVRSKEEAAIWSAPDSAHRLRKIAHHIAALCRNAQRRTKPPRNAIAKWIADLAWLKHRFYDGTSFSFPWPAA